MFKVLEKDGRTVPMICCDVCGSWIDEIGHGAAVFASPQQNGDVEEVLMVHKGACHDKAEAQLRAKGKSTGWQELNRHLRNALHNGGLSAETIGEQQRSDDESGTGYL